MSKQSRILSKYIRIFVEVYSQNCRNSLAYLSKYCRHLSKLNRIGVDVKFCRAKLPIPCKLLWDACIDKIFFLNNQNCVNFSRNSKFSKLSEICFSQLVLILTLKYSSFSLGKKGNKCYIEKENSILCRMQSYRIFHLTNWHLKMMDRSENTGHLRVGCTVYVQWLFIINIREFLFIKPAMRALRPTKMYRPPLPGAISASLSQLCERSL